MIAEPVLILAGTYLLGMYYQAGKLDGAQDPELVEFVAKAKREMDPLSFCTGKMLVGLLWPLVLLDDVFGWFGWLRSKIRGERPGKPSS